jgi:L-glyceraldehyde 3-phosphate reductase
MLNRWIEHDKLLDRLQAEGMGCIAFSPLAQGLLTNKYLSGVPNGSRATANKSLLPQFINEQTLTRVKALSGIAKRRGQSLAQMALAWAMRDSRMTTVLIGASRPEQVEDCVGALTNLNFEDKELSDIDQHAIDSDINLWSTSSSY